MSQETKNLRWGVERRLEFIEFCLFWDGSINRSQLMEIFGISANQATADLNRYLSVAPENMVYDKRGRAYVCTGAFRPRFLEPDAGRYLAQIRSVADGILDRSETWIRHFPAYDAAPTPLRNIREDILRSVLLAIRRSEAIEINYQSLSRPEPMWRWVAPHAIGFDGFRWHARAFCEVDYAFKDFVLARILGIRATKPAGCNPGEDIEWDTQVILEIGPHPGLSDTQRRVISLDYGMSGGKTSIRVRRSSLYYTLRRFGLDTDPSARRPEDQQIVLLNRETVISHLNSAGAEG